MTAAKTLEDLVSEHGVDPLRVLLDIADGNAVALGLLRISEATGRQGLARRNRLLPPALRFRAASEVMQYLHGKRSAVSVSTRSSGSGSTVKIYMPDNHRSKPEMTPKSEDAEE